MQQSLFPISGLGDSHVKMSRWREWGREQGLKGRALVSFMTLLDYLKRAVPEFLLSKTFRAYYLPTGDETSEPLYERWPTSGIVSDGVCLTAKTSESPSHAVESTLSDVIETGEVPSRYFLSWNAAKGMLRRANRMGRPLFPPLRKALEILSKGQSTNE